MFIKRNLIITIILAIFCFFHTGISANNLTVKSNPDGAQVKIEGDVTVSGVTPTLFRHTLIGTYKIKVSKYGYETYETKVLLDPSKQMELNVDLSKKTRFKAAARSLLIPGWGQRYADQSFKGKAFTVLAITSLVGYYFTDKDFDREYDRYQEHLKEYDELLETGTYDQIQAKLPILLDHQERAYNMENRRRIAIGTVIGAWSLSFLDALFFFPEEEGAFTVKGMQVQPEASLDKVGLNLMVSF